MKPRNFLILLAAVCLLGGCGFNAPPKPNVIFLLTDDQRPDAVAALGNPDVKTPNLDRLVHSGFVFTNAYNLGSNVPAVCAPSRNMILSGRAYFRWEGRYAPPEPANLADSMNDAGYETYHYGKKGNTALKIHQRFQHSRYLDDEASRTSGEPGKMIVDGAIEFLSSRQSKKPFFLYLAFAAPHDPRIAAKKYMDLYRQDQIALPGNYLPVHPFDNGEMVIRDELLAPWPRTKDEIRRHLHDYYATISALDHHIGRLLEYLKDNHLDKNTYVIFSSDQGLAIGSHGLMGKQNLYEDSAKAPLVFTGPDIEPGRSDALVYLLDIYPTILSLTGIPPVDGLDGVSLAPVIYHQSNRVRKSLFLAYKDLQRAIRDDRYKLIVYPYVGVTQLFDLENDPLEKSNLAGDPAYARRIEAMTEGIALWQEQLGDTAPLYYGDPADPRFTPPTGQALAKLKARWGME